MAEAEAGDLEPETVANYKPPEKKSLDEIKNLDADDESLKKYKEMLLKGSDKAGKPCPDDERNVVVDKLIICPEGRPETVINLRGDIDNLKKNPVTLKEGCKYHVKILYFVQSEIVSGLKYVMATYRGPLKDKETVMLGSYAPRMEAYEWKSKDDEAPKGMMARGTYNVKSQFIDDDKTIHLAWEWRIEIKKDWE